MSAVVRFCIENKLVVGLVVAFVIGWGVRVAPFDWQVDWLPRDPVPVDAIPDIGENQQIVFTEWMGRSPQDVEDQVTYPLTVALLGIPGVKTVRSYSFFGFSSVYVIFEEDIDFYWSRSRILEKLASLPAGTLPLGVKPALGPDATALGQVFWYTLEGRDPKGRPTGGWNLDELRTVQDWYVRYALLSAGGVSEVASVGGFVREYQVDVDPDAMRAHRVTLGQVVDAVRRSNLDVGARTIEVNRAEYVVRGLGFVRSVADLEKVVVRSDEHVPIRVSDVARVGLGPALRRGALDKEGAEAVGGVVVVRYGDNPLAAIKNVKAKIAELAPGLPRKVVIDFSRVRREEVEAFAAAEGFAAYRGAELDQEAWVAWALRNPDRLPAWAALSQVTVVPFYDRTGLIYETLGTLNTALSEEILISIIVVIAMVLHLRSSVLISGLLPLAVLLCFIFMKYFHVDANVVALSGIAIAIGTMVDMGIILCENILRHLDEAPAEESRLEVVHRAAVEVGGAVVTAVSTTIVSFLPVFSMEAAEGKLFRPLAFTKTFALFGSIIVALTIIPPIAHLLFRKKSEGEGVLAWIGPAALVPLGLAAFWLDPVVAFLVLGMSALGFARPFLLRRRPARERTLTYASNGLAVLAVVVVLSEHWLPLGPSKGSLRNFAFVAALVGGLLGSFLAFQQVYPYLLRAFLAHKRAFLCLPAALLGVGLSVWWGAKAVLPWYPASVLGLVVASEVALRGLENARRARSDPAFAPLWLVLGTVGGLFAGACVAGVSGAIYRLDALAGLRSSLERTFPGLGKEFMPPLDEGSYLYMPTTMPHASIGEAQDVLAKLDLALASVPEV
ncbi:MAG: efflux RND transporter permease subunit, partial [Planctomycetota bacterium]